MSDETNLLGSIARCLLERDDEELLAILQELKSNIGNYSGEASEVMINLNHALVAEMRFQVKAEKKELTRNLPEREVCNLLNALEGSEEAAKPKAVRLRTLHARQLMLPNAL